MNFREKKTISVFKNTWIFVLSGGLGVYSVIQQLLNSSVVGDHQAWMSYILLRLPHHLYPGYWQGNKWWIIFVLALVVSIVLFIIINSKKHKLLLGYLSTAMMIFCLGLLIYLAGNIDLLRFYWFRLADVMFPLLGVILGLSILMPFEDSVFSKEASINRIIINWQKVIHKHRYWIDALVISLALFITILQLTDSLQSLKRQHQSSIDIQTMYTWIEKNTTKDEVFLIDPTIPDFYISAQRSTFCSYKHIPSFADEIMVWYERIKFCNGGKDLNVLNNNVTSELHNNFYNLEWDQIRTIADTNQLTYFLARNDKVIDLHTVYMTEYYVLYKMR